jgi:hypothetical protein
MPDVIKKNLTEIAFLLDHARLWETLRTFAA